MHDLARLERQLAEQDARLPDDGGFNFCRLAFQTGRFRRGGNWSVDYPRADVNLSIRLSGEAATAFLDDAKERGIPVEGKVESLMVRNSSDGRARNCYWPMPFRKSCKITLANVVLPEPDSPTNTETRPS